MRSEGEIQQKYNKNALQLFFLLSLNMLFHRIETIEDSHMHMTEVELCALNGQQTKSIKEHTSMTGDCADEGEVMSK